MKKIYSILVLGTFLVLPFAVNAQSINLRLENRAEFEAKREMHLENRASVEARVEERRAKVLENRTEIKARLDARTQTRVGGHLDNIVNIFDRIVTRLETASDRIENRIEDFEEKGVDVSATVELFAEAEAELDDTKEVLAEIKADLEVELEKDEVSRDQIKALVQTARESIQKTKKAYADVLVSLRADVGASNE